MKALILAAGKGSRLNPITEEKPKAMVEVDGIPLLVRTIENLIENNIRQIGIVIGYKGAYIKKYIGEFWNGAYITYIENDEFECTNNMVSLYKAKEYLDDDMLLLECDVLFQRDVINELCNVSGECVMLVSPYNPKTMDGTIVQVKDNKAVSLILGKWQNSENNYLKMKKTVNIYKFEKSFLQNIFLPQLETYLQVYDKNSYYEIVLGGIIYYRLSDIRAVEISDERWSEIDDIDDLNLATKKIGKW